MAHVMMTIPNEVDDNTSANTLTTAPIRVYALREKKRNFGGGAQCHSSRLKWY